LLLNYQNGYSEWPNNPFQFQGPRKFTRLWIFGLKRNHLPALVWKQRDLIWKTYTKLFKKQGLYLNICKVLNRFKTIAYSKLIFLSLVEFFVTFWSLFIHKYFWSHCLERKFFYEIDFEGEKKIRK
jgi:hypothetical protein